MLTGYGTAFLVSSLPGVKSLWYHPTEDPPTRESNIPVSTWVENVERVLVRHIDSRTDITPAQRADGIAGARAIAESYVNTVHERARSVFDVEDSSDVMFGRNGAYSGWIGNTCDIGTGGARDCDRWATQVKRDVHATSGWKVIRVEDSLKAGDAALGFVFKHNFVLLEFDPNNDRSLNPAFVLDPWPRARPDIFDFDDFNEYWPIEGRFMYE